MRFQIKINGTDLSENVLLEECTIRQALSGEIGTANFTLLVDQAIGPRYNFANFGAAKYSTAGDIETWDTVEILIAGASPPELLFSGYASRVAYERRAPNLDEWRFECQDHTLLLDTVIVNETWTDKTDQYIIQDAFSALSEVDTTNVASTQTLASFEAKDLTLRKLVERLRQITGADWHLTPDKDLYYDTSNFAAAPFGLSDDPDESTTYPYELQAFNRDQSQLANRVTVLGALNPSGGSELSATVNDTDDQTERGRVVSRTLVERSITNTSVLTIKANMELTKRVAVQESGELVCWRDGLGVGQGVSIVSSAFSINGTYRIRELEITKVSESEAAYRVVFGEEQAKLTELLRQFNLAKTKVDQAIPPDGTIGDSKFDRTTDPIQIANADIVSLEYSKVSNVLVTNSDIQDLTIQEGKIANLTITGGKIANSTITDSKIVSLEYSKVSNVLVTNSDIENLTIQAGKIANLTITGGKIADSTITSAKIDTLVVSKITGWEGETITVGSGGLTFSGTGGIEMAGGGNLVVTPGYVSAYSVRGGLGGIDIPAAVAPYKMGGTTVIDTNRHGSLVNLALTGTFRLGTSATAGHVLTADASGYGTWQAAGGGGITSINSETGAAQTLQGTTNQINVNSSSDTHTFSTPQNIHTGASPTFAALTLTDDLTADDIWPTTDNTYQIGSLANCYQSISAAKFEVVYPAGDAAWNFQSTQSNYLKLTAPDGSTVVQDWSTSASPYQSVLRADLIPTSDDTYDLGDSSYYWAEAYIRNLKLRGDIDVHTTDVYFLGDSTHYFANSYVRSMYANSAYLTTVLQMGGTTVLNSSRSLVNIFDITNTGYIDSAGYVDAASGFRVNGSSVIGTSGQHIVREFTGGSFPSLSDNEIAIWDDTGTSTKKLVASINAANYYVTLTAA